MATIFLDEIAGAYIIPGYTSYKYKRREGQLVSVTDNYNVDEYLINTDTYLEIDSFFFLNISLFSGTLSELLYTGTFNKSGFSGDCAQTIGRYEEFGMMGFGANGIYTYAEHTIKILKKNWKNIRFIADDLYKVKTLYQKYFRKALKSLDINRIPPLEEVWDFF